MSALTPAPLLAAALIVALTACTSHRGEASADPSSASGAVSPSPQGCADPSPSATEKVGGPMALPSNTITQGLRSMRPGELVDAAVIQLARTGNEPLLIDSVDLVTEDGSQPLRLTGSFVDPNPNSLHIRPASKKPPGVPAIGYCVLSQEATQDQRGGGAPILVLRLGPAVDAKPSRLLSGPALSRDAVNNSVDVHYRTPDGQRWVVAFPERFDIPVSG